MLLCDDCTDPPGPGCSLLYHFCVVGGIARPLERQTAGPITQSSPSREVTARVLSQQRPPGRQDPPPRVDPAQSLPLQGWRCPSLHRTPQVPGAPSRLLGCSPNKITPGFERICLGHAELQRTVQRAGPSWMPTVMTLADEIQPGPSVPAGTLERGF